jgi:RNA polymerase sigma-70 factor (ECF subfamily)
MAAKRVTKQVGIQTLSDVELIERFQKGCSMSFNEIVSRYESKAYNLAMRLTRNTEDAEEVLQDVFVTVYRKVAGFEGKSKFSSWLYRITVNAAFMKLRKRRQDHSVALEDVMPNLHNVTTLAPQSIWSMPCDSLAVSNEVRIALESAIARLPEEYRAVFILRDIDGLSNKEVGDILDLSIPAVKSRLHRSRLMLRKRLRRFYEDYLAQEKTQRRAA